MDMVYEAEQDIPQRIVALKVIRAWYSTGRDDVGLLAEWSFTAPRRSSAMPGCSTRTSAGSFTAICSRRTSSSMRMASQRFSISAWAALLILTRRATRQTNERDHRHARLHKEALATNQTSPRCD
jgi:hypothetical protein